MLALLLAALALTDPAGPAPLLAQAQTPPAEGPEAPRPPARTVPPARPGQAARPVLPTPPAPPVLPAPPVAPVAHAGTLLRGEWPSQPSGKRVSIEDTAHIDDALEEIADAAGWDISLNTGRTGNRLLVLKLRDVPVEDALKVVLTGSGLVATRHGNIVTVGEEELPIATPQTLVGFDKPTGKTFSGDFEGAPASEALRQIARAAGLSIVLPPDETTPITASFKDVPVEDALRAVLQQADLVAERQGSLVTVKADGEGGFPALPPGLPKEARRAAERAMREAHRELARATRDHAEEQRGHAENGRDRQAANGDLTIRGGDSVRDVSVQKGNLVMEGGSAARDASVVLGSATLQGGAAVRDLSVVFGSATLDPGANARQVVAIGGDVVIGPGASVEQEAVSIGGRVRVDPDAEVGDTSSIPFPTIPNMVSGVFLHAFGGPSSPIMMGVEVLVRFAVLFVLALLCLSVFPRRLEAVTTSMIATPFKSVLAGLLGSLAMPVLALLLIVTIVGIPLVFVQMLLVVAAGVLGISALTYYVGRHLPLSEDRRTTVLQLALGTLVFSVLAQVPVLGAAVWVASWLLTFGAVIRTRFGQPPAALPTTLPPAPGMGV